MVTPSAFSVASTCMKERERRRQGSLPDGGPTTAHGPRANTWATLPPKRERHSHGSLPRDNGECGSFPSGAQSQKWLSCSTCLFYMSSFFACRFQPTPRLSNGAADALASQQPRQVYHPHWVWASHAKASLMVQMPSAQRLAFSRWALNTIRQDGTRHPGLRLEA